MSFEIIEVKEGNTVLHCIVNSEDIIVPTMGKPYIFRDHNTWYYIDKHRDNRNVFRTKNRRVVLFTYC